MSLPEISLALGRDYDRTRPLMDGRVPVKGVNLNPMILENVEEVFFRMGRNAEFDVAEMSTSSYMVMRSRHDPPPFIALPVFPSKMFRHSNIFVHVDSGIREPKDLKGKIMGVPEYVMTAALWIKGLLKHEYGVDVTDLRWRQGGQEEPGRTDNALGAKSEFNLPAGTEIAQIPVDRTLSDMLGKGEIDAFMGARIPSSFYWKESRVRRLFPNYHEVEREYYARTKILPIMHVVVMRWETYRRYPWLAVNLVQAFEEAKRIAFAGLYDTSALLYGLPWLVPLLEEQRAVFGENHWSYGVDANRAALELMVRMSHEQGLSARRLTVEELFAKETLESGKI